MNHVQRQVQMKKDAKKAKRRLTKSGTGRQRVGAMRGSAAAGGFGVLSRTLLAEVQTQTPLMLGAETQTQRQMESEREEKQSERESHTD